ncbi:hypothetical protein P3342_008039 [Pyrenophora teres f. teres]|nr:hypothetical protein P3342_008039 [Pyrenophora teres f. teres]
MSNDTNRIVHALSQTPILDSLSSYTSTTSLDRLGLVCRTIGLGILDETSKIKEALRKRTRCDGVGMRVRGIFHKPPPGNHKWQPFSTTARFQADDVEYQERPCDTCGVMTCDESRTHLVY